MNIRLIMHGCININVFSVKRRFPAIDSIDPMKLSLDLPVLIRF